jgi:hypothetical protein
MSEIETAVPNQPLPARTGCNEGKREEHACAQDHAALAKPSLYSVGSGKGTDKPEEFEV